MIRPVLLQPGDHPTKLSRILLGGLVAAAGSRAYVAKFNLKLGHAVNTTDGQHAAAMCNGIVPNTAAMELPFVFRNAQHAYAVLDGDVGTGVLNELSAHGLKGLLVGTPLLPRWKVFSL